MAQRRLHELLKEDQEPFLLNKYISDRRSQLNRPSHNTTLQVKKRKSIYQNSNFPGNFCKNACFFSFSDTPDLRKSPLFQLASPAKSPSSSPNPIFLHIPARTAALLLEAALRIQKQSSSSSKTKPQHKNNAFGLFGSLFKRLTQGSRNRKREIEGEGVKASVKDILRWDSSVGCTNHSNVFSENTDSQKDNHVSDGSACEVEFGCSYNGRPSSAVWSESNEDKSLGMEETSSSSQWDECEEIECVIKENHNTECACCDDALCESPFRFVLLRSPSSACSTPELSSPASFPSRHATQDKENNGAKSVEEFQSGEGAEEKEQCSPVSVLDPPFEDDEYGHDDNNDEEDDGFDMESSYAIVQRAKEQLLCKLRRFEKLAELDPLELEKTMFDQEDDYDNDETFVEEDECEDNSTERSEKERDITELVSEVVCQSSWHERGQIPFPGDLKRLICDLIMEEREQSLSEDREKVVRGVCKRLELWKEVETNTIDMMVEQDFRREEGGWKKNVEQMREVAGELELAVFEFLMEEVSEELVCYNGLGDTL